MSIGKFIGKRIINTLCMIVIFSNTLIYNVSLADEAVLYVPGQGRDSVTDENSEQLYTPIPVEKEPLISIQPAQINQIEQPSSTKATLPTIINGLSPYIDDTNIIVPSKPISTLPKNTTYTVGAIKTTQEFHDTLIDEGRSTDKSQIQYTSDKVNEAELQSTQPTVNQPTLEDNLMKNNERVQDVTGGPLIYIPTISTPIESDKNIDIDNKKVYDIYEDNRMTVYDPATATTEEITSKELPSSIKSFVSDINTTIGQDKNPTPIQLLNDRTDYISNDISSQNNAINVYIPDYAKNREPNAQIRDYGNIKVIIPNSISISRIEKTQNNIGVTIYEGTSYKTYNPENNGDNTDIINEYQPSIKIVDTQLGPDSLVFDEKPIEGMLPVNQTEPFDSQDIQESFEFGIKGEDIVFSKPIKIEVETDQENINGSGYTVEIYTKHASDEFYNTVGLSTDPNTLCDGEGNPTIPGNIIKLENNKLTFYTCRASKFVVIDSGSNLTLSGQTCDVDISRKNISNNVIINSGDIKIDYSKGFTAGDGANTSGSINNTETGNVFLFRASQKPFAIGLTNTSIATNNYHSYTEMRAGILFRDDNKFQIISSGGIYGAPFGSWSVNDSFYFDIWSGGAIGFYDKSGNVVYTGWSFTLSGDYVLDIDMYSAGVGDSYPETRLKQVSLIPYTCINMCGNGIVGTGEQCDDGNLTNFDGCSSSCNLDTVPACDKAWNFVISPKTGTGPVASTGTWLSYTGFTVDSLFWGTGSPVSNPTSPSTHTYTGGGNMTGYIHIVNNYSGSVSGYCYVTGISIIDPSVDGSCGSLSGAVLYDFTGDGNILTGGSIGLCSPGTVSGFAFNSSTHIWNRDCAGSGGGATMSCSASSEYCGDGNNEGTGLDQLILIDKNWDTGTTGNNDVSYARISDDGRYTVMSSNSSNLVTGDVNGRYDIFVYDDRSHTIKNITLGGNNNSYSSDISADGRYIVFDSAASNLVAGDTNGKTDIFIYDRQTNVTTNITQANGSNSSFPRISADGNYIIFIYNSHIYIYNRSSQVTTALTNSSNGTEEEIYISPDGGYISFISSASNLVAGDVNGKSDAFIYDISGNVFTNITLSGNNYSVTTSISSGGKYVGFVTTATNIGTGGTGFYRYYIYDKQSGISTFLGEGNRVIDISAEGDYITYGDSSGFNLYHRPTGTRKLISTSEYPYATSISAGGKKMVFNNQHAYIIKLQGSEQCDDGNGTNTDACSNSCTLNTPSCSAFNFAVSPTTGSVPKAVTGSWSSVAGFTVTKINWTPTVFVNTPSSPIGYTYLTAGNYTGFITVANNLSGGITATCSVSLSYKLDGVCGSRDDDIIYDFNNGGDSLTGGSANLCSNGSVASFSFNSTTHTWSWNCNGANGGNNVSCNATETYCGDSSTSNGEQCDDGNGVNTDACSNSCTLNTPSCSAFNFAITPTTGSVPKAVTGTWSSVAGFTVTKINWTPTVFVNTPSNPIGYTYLTAGNYTGFITIANNLSGGITATCSVSLSYKLDGVCGSRDDDIIYDFNNGGDSLTGGSANLCSNGSVASFSFNSTTHTWSWNCNGANGGNNVSCSTQELYCGDGIISDNITGGLVGYWRLENTGADSSPMGNHGILRNGVAFTGGKIGTGGFFNNNNSYVEVPATEDLDVDGDTDMSFSVWVKPVSGDYGFILSKPWDSNGLYNYYIKNYNGTITFFIAAKVGSSVTLYGTITQGQRQHIAGVIDKNSIRLYINGNQVSSATNNFVGRTSGNGRPVAIGTLYPYGQGWVGNSGRVVDGSIDDVRIYNRALTSTEVEGLYNMMEICDDGNANNDDACSNSCTLNTPSCPAFNFTIAPTTGTVPRPVTGTWSGVAGFTVTKINWTPTVFVNSPSSPIGYTYLTAGNYTGFITVANNLSGAITATCSVSLSYKLDGVCGSRNGSTIYDFDNGGDSLTGGSANLCSNGSVASFSFNSTTHVWSWNCNGVNGGNNVSCSATETYCGNGSTSNGEQCDDGNGVNTDACSNSCTLNTPSCPAFNFTIAPTTGTVPRPVTGTWSGVAGFTVTKINWTPTVFVNTPSSPIGYTYLTAGNYTGFITIANNLSGGITATCSVSLSYKLDGVCGSRDDDIIYDFNNGGDSLTGGSANLCSNGSVGSFSFNSTTHTWSWNCNGANGGNNVSCNATETYCGDGDIYTGNINNGLVGYRSFDNNDARDDSNNGNSGTLNGGVLFTGGRFGTAAQFDGIDDYISISPGPVLSGTGSETISLRIRTNNPLTNYIFSAHDGGGGAYYRRFFMTYVNIIDVNNTYYTLDYNKNVQDNIWHHIAYIKSGSNINIYIDGGLKDSDTIGAELRTMSAYYIGRACSGNCDPSKVFSGQIDDVRIYNRALSSGDIGYLYNMSEQCDDGDMDNTNACLNTCTLNPELVCNINISPYSGYTNTPTITVTASGQDWASGKLFYKFSTLVSSLNPVSYGTSINATGLYSFTYQVSNPLSGGITTSCTATGYLGYCGDSIVNGGEQCDHGSSNGQTGNSCNSTCENIAIIDTSKFISGENNYFLSGGDPVYYFTIGDLIEFNFKIENTGAAPFSGNWTDDVYDIMHASGMNIMDTYLINKNFKSGSYTSGYYYQFVDGYDATCREYNSSDLTGMIYADTGTILAGILSGYKYYGDNQNNDGAGDTPGPEDIIIQPGGYCTYKLQFKVKDNPTNGLNSDECISIRDYMYYGYGGLLHTVNPDDLDYLDICIYNPQWTISKDIGTGFDSSGYVIGSSIFQSGDNYIYQICADLQVASGVVVDDLKLADIFPNNIVDDIDQISMSNVLNHGNLDTTRSGSLEAIFTITGAGMSSGDTVCINISGTITSDLEVNSSGEFINQACIGQPYLSGDDILYTYSGCDYATGYIVMDGVCGNTGDIYDFDNSGNVLTGGSTGLCDVGTISGFVYDSGTHQRNWNCNGINGGSNVSCEIQELYCGDGIIKTGNNIIGLVNHWKFDNNTDDTTGNKNGTASGGVSFETGIINSAILLNGIDSSVGLSSSITLGNSGRSMSVRSKTTAGGMRSIFSNKSGGPVSSLFGIYDGKIYFKNYDSSWYDHTGGVSVNDGKWHLLTRVNKSDHTMDMYVDGDYATGGFNSYANNGGPIDIIGAMRGVNNRFSGWLDDLRIYNRTLSPGEIQDLYNIYEQCDDGNTNNNDACSNSCTINIPTCSINITPSSSPGSPLTSPADITGVFYVSYINGYTSIPGISINRGNGNTGDQTLLSGYYTGTQTYQTSLPTKTFTITGIALSGGVPLLISGEQVICTGKVYLQVNPSQQNNICGDGILSGGAGEQCEHTGYTYCSDGTKCDEDADCDGIGDMSCEVRKAPDSDSNGIAEPTFDSSGNMTNICGIFDDDCVPYTLPGCGYGSVNACEYLVPNCSDMNFTITPNEGIEGTSVTGTRSIGPSWVDIDSLYRGTGNTISNPISPQSYTYTSEGYYTGVLTLANTLSGGVTATCEVLVDIWGDVCIGSPELISFGTKQVQSTTGVYTTGSDYFNVKDRKGSDSGYYTTLSISDFTGSNGNTIPNSMIDWKAVGLTHLDGDINTNILMHATMNTRHTADGIDTFIYRSTGPNDDLRSTYGSKLDLRINIPPYTSVGTYTGVITYTLHEY